MLEQHVEPAEIVSFQPSILLETGVDLARVLLGFVVLGLSSLRMKALARRVVGLLPTVVAYHIHNTFHLLTGKRGPVRQLEYLKDWSEPPIVAAGPFQGMAFTRKTYSSSLVASLMGTHEMELHEAVAEFVAYEPDVLANVGAGEGYYAVGMALRLPKTIVLAYEMLKPANHILGRVAKANGVSERLKRPGRCTVRKLDKGLRDARRPAVICDCEGAEDILLDPIRVSALARAAILVELHDHFNPGVSLRIRERFEFTHELRIYETRGRTMADLPPGCSMTPAQLEEMVVEHRGARQQFYFMLPRNRQE